MNKTERIFKSLFDDDDRYFYVGWAHYDRKYLKYPRIAHTHSYTVSLFGGLFSSLAFNTNSTENDSFRF